MKDAYDEIRKDISRAFAIVLAGILFLLMLQLCSCTRTVYVPQVSIQRDSIYLTTHTRDSVWLRDSVVVREKGDTVWLERWRTKYVERMTTDTAYIERADTVRMPYPVERQLTWKERACMEAGRWTLHGGAAVILALGAFYVYRRRKK